MRRLFRQYERRVEYALVWAIGKRDPQLIVTGAEVSCRQFGHVPEDP